MATKNPDSFGVLTHALGAKNRGEAVSTEKENEYSLDSLFKKPAGSGRTVINKNWGEISSKAEESDQTLETFTGNPDFLNIVTARVQKINEDIKRVVKINGNPTFQDNSYCLDDALGKLNALEQGRDYTSDPDDPSMDAPSAP